MGPRRGDVAFISKTNTTDAEGGGKRGFQRPTWYNPEWPYWNLCQTEHIRCPPWLQTDRIFGQDKGCSRSQADVWVLIKVGFNIIFYLYLYPGMCLELHRGDRLAQLWTCCLSPSGKILSCPETFLHTSWQPYHLYFSKAGNFQPRLRLHAWQELVLCEHGQCLLAWNGFVFKQIRKSIAWEKEGLLSLF